MGNRGFKNLISWHHLLCAPLLFSFQQVIIINPALSKDAVSTVENPAFFFAGYLAMSLIICLACAWPRARTLIKKVPTVAALLVLVLGMLAAYAHVLLEMGSPTIRLIAGACTGLAGSIIFLKWCSMLAHLKITVLAKTTALAFTIAYAMALVSSCFLRSVEGSLTSMLVAIFISALPLEALQKRDCQSADSVSSSPNFNASNVRSLLTGWWPFLASTFVTYAITGFSWGNALFNEFDYFVLGPSWLNPAGSFFGAFIIFVATVKNETHSIPRWPLPICVGLLLSSWLLFVTFGQNATDLTVPLTGVAFGMLDPLLLAWACAVPRSHGVDPLISAAFGRGASLIPIALGILLAPLLHMTRTLATTHDFLHDLSTYEGTRVSPAHAARRTRP